MIYRITYNGIDANEIDWEAEFKANKVTDNRTMNYQTIKRLQREEGFYDMQKLIDNGTAWKMEGSVGREAMDLLRSGACMLPKKAHTDYYGNRIPSRDELKQGTMGTFQNCLKFYNQ
jgi:hypothetical protein